MSYIRYIYTEYLPLSAGTYTGQMLCSCIRNYHDINMLEVAKKYKKVRFPQHSIA